MTHVVYPGHGPMRFEKKEQKSYGGVDNTFLVYKCVSTDMRVCIPEKDAESLTRPLTSEKEALEVKTYLEDGVDPKISTQTWNRRYRQYNDKLKSGSLKDIACVLKELISVSKQKELSFGEKKMMALAQQMVSCEIKLVLG